MLLVPARDGVKRLEVPWVSTAIVVLCVLVQLASDATAPSEDTFDEAASRVSEVQTEILKHHRIQGRALFGALTEAQWEFLRTYRTGEFLDADPTLRERLLTAEAEFDAARASHLSLRLANRSADGISPRILTAAFAHGDWVHLLSNLIFLWLIGTHLEVLWGPRRFALLYLLGIIAADVVYSRYHPGSQILLGGAGADRGGPRARGASRAGPERARAPAPTSPRPSARREGPRAAGQLIG